ncbi:MAG: sensor domain-containing diguanylate cyclase [Psychrobium sp.]
MSTAVMRIIIACVLLVSFVSHASQSLRLVLDKQSTSYQYFASDNRELTFEQIRRLDNTQWVSASEFEPYGLIDRKYWLKLAIDIPEDYLQQPLYLELANPLVDRLDIYLVMGKATKHYVGGDAVKTDKRPVATPTHYFPLPISESGQLEIYIKYQDEAASLIPLAITNSGESLESAHAHGVFTGIIGGVVVLMMIMTGIIHHREPNSINQFYFGILLFGGLSILSLEGIASVYIWGGVPWLQNILMPPLFLLTSWCTIELTRRLLASVLSESPRIEKLYKWLSPIVLICAAILFALPTFIAVVTAIFILLTVLLIMIGTLSWLYKTTKQVSLLVLGTWLSFVISLVLTATYYSGVISLPNYVLSIATTIYSFPFVFWAALILLNLLQQKDSVYQAKLDQLDDTQLELSQAKEELEEHYQEQQTMEALVDERTFELNVTLRELQETNRQLEEQATNDALTGVKNRKFFDQRLLAEYRLSRRQQTPLSLLLLDADKFKLVNDTHGHLAGDQVLIKIAQIASRILKRPNDYVCRYGGEEFAILLSNTDQTGACKVAEVIRQKIADTVIKTEAIDLQVTVSIGVSTLFVDAQTSDSQLFEQADQALYHAKASGRNNIKTFQEFEDSVNQ